MKLYGFWRSSCSWRVRIALAYKGIEHEHRPVHLTQGGGEQFRDGYREVNPMRQVPVLEYEEGGVTRRVSQSMAILELLEELHPRPPLLPPDPYLRARARQLAEIVNSGIQPFQNLSVQKLIKDELGGDDVAFTRRFIERGLIAFQASAAEVSGRFSVGDEVSLADVLLAPQLYQARRFGVDLAGLPALTRIEDACMALPAFQSAHAERQVDAVPAAS